jgi:hypothetical protein
MSTVAIHKDLVNTLGSDAITYSTVTLYLREAQFEFQTTLLPPTSKPRHVMKSTRLSWPNSDFLLSET